MNDNNKKLFLIDGNSICYRAFYAIQELRTSKGMPTNAIYGFIAMLKKIIKDQSPGYLAIAFDMKGPTNRHEKYAEYKVQRKPMPDDLKVQIPRIKEVVNAYNIPLYEMQGIEADDIIATLAYKAVKKGLEVVIITGDKDALQLVDDNIKVLSPQLKENKLYDDKEVKAKFGVEPCKMVELMSLMGDTSDNVPGVQGIGPVTAGKLINEYGSLNGLYDSISKISSESLRKKLEEGKDSAYLSRELVILDKDLSLDLDLEKVKMSDPDNDKLSELFKEFEFNKLLQEISAKEVRKEAGPVEYNKCAGKKEIEKVLKGIESSKVFSFCLKRNAEGVLTGLAVSFSDAKAFYLPVDGEVSVAVKKIFDTPGINKVGYDIKNDMNVLDPIGAKWNDSWFDVMIADYLLEPSIAKRDVPGIALRRLGISMADPGGKEALWDKKGQATLDFAEKEEDLSVLFETADMLFRTYGILNKELHEKELFKLFNDVEMPLVKILADMEKEGIGVDLAYVKKMSGKMEKDIAEVMDKIYASAGEEFNINSPKQLQVILFEKLKLPPVRKTKTGASTDEDVLSRLSDKHELPRLILEYRGMNKLKTTYYDAIEERTDEKTHKLHTHFNQAVTATGRLSSSEPNLQNIPVKTQMGRAIRKAFIPGGKDKVFIAADYSQIELRVLAHLSGDKGLAEAFEREEDVHKYTAALIFDVDMADVTKEMRSVAKTVNFGVVYGMSSYGLAQDLGIGVAEAEKFINSYFERYSGVKKFMDKTIEDARKNGYVTTLLNRRRYIPEITSSNQHIKGFAERAAINTPVQGSAADLIKMAMMVCHKEFAGTGVSLTLQVHDELIFTVPKKEAGGTAQKVKELMEGVMELDVPLRVDVEAGSNWLELEKVL